MNTLTKTMKKNILFVIYLFFIQLTVHAADWKEIYQKNYIDVNSIMWEKNTVSFWMKSLNPGNWEPINNKKIWYNKDNVLIDCKKRRLAIKSVVTYDLNQNVINSFEEQNEILLQWNSIVPETNGEILYETFCTPNKK